MMITLNKGLTFGQPFLLRRNTSKFFYIMYTIYFNFVVDFLIEIC